MIILPSARGVLASAAYAMVAAALSVASPTVGAPVAALRGVALPAATSIAVASPVRGSPALGVKHSLVAAAFAVASPVCAAGVILQKHKFIGGLTVSSPVLGAPTFSKNKTLHSHTYSNTGTMDWPYQCDYMIAIVKGAGGGGCSGGSGIADDGGISVLKNHDTQFVLATVYGGGGAHCQFPSSNGSNGGATLGQGVEGTTDHGGGNSGGAGTRIGGNGGEAIVGDLYGTPVQGHTIEFTLGDGGRASGTGDDGNQATVEFQWTLSSGN